jgi:hypothetical protein
MFSLLLTLKQILIQSFHNVLSNDLFQISQTAMTGEVRFYDISFMVNVIGLAPQRAVLCIEHL